MLNGQSMEVFVQAFSGDDKIALTGSQLQVSDGGAAPVWVNGGRELYYNRVVQKVWTGDMMAVAVTLTPRLSAEVPRRLLSADLADGIHTKVATADGSRLLLVLDAQDPTHTTAPRLTVVTDWQARLPR